MSGKSRIHHRTRCHDFFPVSSFKFPFPLFTSTPHFHSTLNSSFRFPVSGLRSPVSGLRSPVSGLRSQVSGLRSQVTGHRSQVTGHRSQVSGHRSQVSGLRSPVSGLRSQVSNSAPHFSLAKNLEIGILITNESHCFY